MFQFRYETKRHGPVHPVFFGKKLFIYFLWFFCKFYLDYEKTGPTRGGPGRAVFMSPRINYLFWFYPKLCLFSYSISLKIMATSYFNWATKTKEQRACKRLMQKREKNRIQHLIKVWTLQLDKLFQDFNQ